MLTQEEQQAAQERIGTPRPAPPGRAWERKYVMSSRWRAGRWEEHVLCRWSDRDDRLEWCWIDRHEDGTWSLKPRYKSEVPLAFVELDDPEKQQIDREYLALAALTTDRMRED